MQYLAASLIQGHRKMEGPLGRGLEAGLVQDQHTATALALEEGTGLLEKDTGLG